MKAWLQWLLGLLLALGSVGAEAAITCTQLQASGYTTNYLSNTTVGTQSSLSLTCNRTSTSDATVVNWGAGANDGNWAQGANNRARRGSTGNNYLRYDLYLTSCGGTAFDSSNYITGSITWPAAQLGSMTGTLTFWTCIRPAQTPTASGAYTDSVTITAGYQVGTSGPITTLTDQHDVTIFAPASCTVKPPPTMNLTYPALSPGPISNAKTFNARCTVGMPYSIGVSPASGTLAGVNYTVTLPAASNGTGLTQTFTITVTAPPGQPGTCSGASCTASQVHTLTLTY